MKNFTRKTVDQKKLKKNKSEVKDYFFRGIVTSYVETIFHGNAF